MMQDDIDHTPLTFGKYKGQTPDAISETKDGASYLVWAKANVTNKAVCSDLLVKACQQDLANNNFGRKSATSKVDQHGFDALDDMDDDCPF